MQGLVGKMVPKFHGKCSEVDDLIQIVGEGWTRIKGNSDRKIVNQRGIHEYGAM